MLPSRSFNWTDTAPHGQLPVDARRMLDDLREVALACRVKRRVDLAEICADLRGERSAGWRAHADVLIRCLDEAIDQPARFFAPGAADLSFDEAWLMQLGQAKQQNRDASFEFLLRSRVVSQHQRLIGMLIARIFCSKQSNLE